MREKNPPYIRRAALALGLLLTPPVADAMDAIVHAVGSLVSADLGKFGFISPALAQPATLTKAQSDALAAYDDAVRHFKSILGQRRAQIDSKQPLPNLPGQALYLARNGMMSAYKDLTDALPSKIGRPNKLGNPAGVFRRRLSSRCSTSTVKLFDVMQAPPANAQKSETPFKDVVDLGTAIARAKGLDAGGCRRGRPHQPGAVLCRDQRQPDHRKCALEQIQGKPANRPVRRSERPHGSGRRSSHRSQPSILR